ncbi:glycosyltransferase family 39 protein, partial [bacterium]
MENHKTLKQVLLLVALSYFCFMFGNSLVSLTIPDEVFYAQTAKEMLKNGSWMTPYIFGQPQFEKPVFLYWLLKSSFMVSGINSFSARFFPAFFGMIGVIAVYFLGRIGFKDQKKAFISAIVLMTAGLYVGLARTVFTDLVFSILILLSLLSFYWGYSFRNRKGTGILLFFIFAGLATLTKGPLGLLIPLLTVIVFLLLKKDIKFLLGRYLFWGLLIFSFISLPWYILMFKLYGNAFIHEFFYNDHIRRIIEAEHIGNDTWYFYPFSMIGCIFPWSFFLAAALFFLPRHIKEKDNSFYVFLVCWIAVTFVTFQSAHSKLVSYIFPLFPALAFFCGGFIADSLASEKRGRLFNLALSLSVAAVFLMPLVLIIASIWFKDSLSPYLSSQRAIIFFVSAFLLFGLVMLSLILKKKLLKGIYCLGLFVPLMLYFIPFVLHDIEPYLSSRQACEYLLKNYKVDNLILSSKFFARGVKYYTDKEVAVIDMPGTPFFSPHPIPFLNTQEEVRDFLRGQKTTYAILKKSSVEDIANLVGGEFKYTVLKV